MQSQFLHYIKRKDPTFINYFKLLVVWPLILNESMNQMNQNFCVFFKFIASPNFLLNLTLQATHLSHTRKPTFLRKSITQTKKHAVSKTWEHCPISTAASKLRDGIKHSNIILPLIKAGKHSNSITSLSITPHLDVFVWRSLLPWILGSKMHTQSPPTPHKKRYLFLNILTLHHYF